MSNSIAIEFEHVSKQYRLGLVSTKTLSHDIRRFWITNVLHREDPYLKIGETNDRSTRGNSDYVWALRDIDFKVEQGDVVGIIGKNGAGKSTLLKLLSRVTGPTTGTIRAHGRIGSLLEVGTGFHGEMTGRENIFMNGAILGMTRNEIQAKLDEIIDFSGCERYIDTPVKRYSSGMTVRLGFAVAAFLDPEILVVDEVLAVGDAEFQKKAIGKMQDVSKDEGRTVLFVSHNMASVRQLCRSGVILEKGHIAFTGTADEAVSRYIGGQADRSIVDREGSGHVVFKKYELESELIELGEDLVVNFELEVKKEYFSNLVVAVSISNMQFEAMTIANNFDNNFEIGKYPVGSIIPITCRLKNINLAPGKHRVSLYVGTNDQQFDQIKFAMTFSVDQGKHFILRPQAYNNNFRAVLQSEWRELSVTSL